MSIRWSGKKLELGLMSQEEFQPEKNGYGITRRIAPGKLGQ
jgi:hypothetical protein